MRRELDYFIGWCYNHADGGKDWHLTGDYRERGSWVKLDNLKDKLVEVLSEHNN